MAFTTWAALKEQLLNDIASGDWRTASYDVTNAGGSHSLSYKSLKEVEEFYDFVERQAVKEAAAPASIRTRVRVMGGGGLF